MERKYFKNLTDRERKELKESIFQRLKIEDDTDIHNKRRDSRLIISAIAASVLLIVGVLVFKTADRHDAGKILIARTGENETRHVALADGSVVVLNAASALYSKGNFTSGTREVFLDGNGFFKIKMLADNRRFVVHAKDLQVTVLGTQFNVDARSEQVSVALTSGKVKLNTSVGKSKSAYMLPGDRLQLNADRTSFIKERIDTTTYSAWINGEWNFKNLSLGEIGKLIEEYYNMQIVFKDDRLKNQQMTAIIPVNSLQGLLKVISATLPVNISQHDKQLFIQ